MGREPTRQQYSSGLTYVQNKPAFLQNFGKPTPQPDASSSRGGDDGNGARAGREPLPERPREGEWAGGSDDEGKRGEESDDEWGDVYGGGGDDGPQVVVLKEGRHLTADDVRKERRRAAGKASVSPPPEKKPSTSATSKEPTTKEADGKAGTKAKPVVPKPNTGAKRKLVGEAVSAGQASDTADKGKKKKKKAEKGLLSFNEADGES